MGPEATKGPPLFLNRLAYVGFSLLLKKRKEILYSIVKFRYSEKVTKNYKKFPTAHCFDVTKYLFLKKVGGFFPIFEGFTQYLNFNIAIAGPRQYDFINNFT